MAFGKMFLSALVTVFVLTGSSQAEDKSCSSDQVQVFAKLVACVTKDHPEYFLTVLTKMDNPESMESSDFMCSHPGLMSALAECFLQYVKGCLPPGIASQVATVMPTHQTILRGGTFLCNHRKDLEHPCVKSELNNLMQCSHKKMLEFSSLMSADHVNIQEKMCRALDKERQCFASTLVGCPAAVASDIMSGFLAFFPAENCHIKMPSSGKVLQFRPEVQQH